MMSLMVAKLYGLECVVMLVSITTQLETGKLIVSTRKAQSDGDEEYASVFRYQGQLYRAIISYDGTWIWKPVFSKLQIEAKTTKIHLRVLELWRQYGMPRPD